MASLTKEKEKKTHAHGALNFFVFSRTVAYTLPTLLSLVSSLIWGFSSFLDFYSFLSFVARIEI